VAGPRVLIVDDEPGIRLGVCTYLEACGFDVLDASDCASAVGLLQAHTFDIGVLDYALPDGTALAMLAEIARLQPAMKAIVLTAYPSDTLAREALESGASRFLTKPIELAALRSLLHELTGTTGAGA
jgi:DNA-binding NtrC family response regulator